MLESAIFLKIYYFSKNCSDTVSIREILIASASNTRNNGSNLLKL